MNRLGSDSPVVMASEEISDADALIEIALMLTEWNANISAEETDDGYDITACTALDESVVFRLGESVVFRV